MSDIHNNKRGFTLLELAIGLAVVGLLLGALFQLSAAGTRQINDQMTAQQLQSYIRAAKSFIAAKRQDSSGLNIAFADTAACTDVVASPAVAVGASRDITQSVQCFRQGSLPLTSPANGRYKVAMYRNANIVSSGVNYATYIIVASITGGNAVSRVSLGQIATYVGAEGAAIYPLGESADNAGTAACNEATQDTIRGGFGSNCVQAGLFTGGAAFELLKPATLSYISMLETGVNDDRYLWRVVGPTVDLNRMQTDMGMNTNGIYFGGAAARPSGITGVSGGISLSVAGTPAAGSIIGAGGGIALTGAPVANALTGASGGITTIGGAINTGGGAITTASGGISTGGGGISTGGGDMVMGNGSITAFNGTFSGELRAASFIYTGSDRNIKKDIVQLENQLPQLLQVKGVSYVLKANNQKTMGVIAQDVEAVYPELVAEKNGIKMVNYNGLVGPIIEALRELKAENDNLKKRIEILEQNR